MHFKNLKSRDLDNIGVFQNGMILTTTIPGGNVEVQAAKVTLDPGTYVVSVSCRWVIGFPDSVAYVLDGSTVRGTGLNGGGVSITRVYQQSQTKEVIFSVVQSSGEAKKLQSIILQSARIK